ncbi:hypothetical protein AHF37_12824 [Paragonimus kellicotti]|nr:hypothetical protein AHF37_12824 [Paragonimus kellicotti]
MRESGNFLIIQIFSLGLTNRSYKSTRLYDCPTCSNSKDEVPSIRRSTFTETISDLELYPLGPTPTWKSEDELELLVTDAQEQLENLRENTDENGRLNDETLVR